MTGLNRREQEKKREMVLFSLTLTAVRKCTLEDRSTTIKLLWNFTDDEISSLLSFYDSEYNFILHNRFKSGKGSALKRAQQTLAQASSAYTNSFAQLTTKPRFNGSYLLCSGKKKRRHYILGKWSGHVNAIWP